MQKIERKSFGKKKRFVFNEWNKIEFLMKILNKDTKKAIRILEKIPSKRKQQMNAIETIKTLRDMMWTAPKKHKRSNL